MKKELKPTKYLDLLFTAKELFWKFGIKRVSVEEICKTASVSKMTFYKYFPNKTKLAAIILEDLMQHSMNEWEQVVVGDLSFEEKVREIFRIKSEVSKNISLEFIRDIYDNQASELASIIERHGQRSRELFVKFLEDSQKNGFIRKDIHIEFILHYVDHSSQVIEDKHLLGFYDQPHDLIMEVMNFMFYGLSPKK